MINKAVNKAWQVIFNYSDDEFLTCGSTQIFTNPEEAWLYVLADCTTDLDIVGVMNNISMGKISLKELQIPTSEVFSIPKRKLYIIYSDLHLNHEGKVFLTEQDAINWIDGCQMYGGYEALLDDNIDIIREVDLVLGEDKR